MEHNQANEYPVNTTFIYIKKVRKDQENNNTLRIFYRGEEEKRICLKY